MILYSHGQQIEVPDDFPLYDPFPEKEKFTMYIPDDDETPESEDVGTGLDNDESTHSDDWGDTENDGEEDD